MPHRRGPACVHCGAGNLPVRTCPIKLGLLGGVRSLATQARRIRLRSSLALLRGRWVVFHVHGRVKSSSRKIRIGLSPITMYFTSLGPGSPLDRERGGEGLDALAGGLAGPQGVIREDLRRPSTRSRRPRFPAPPWPAWKRAARLPGVEGDPEGRRAAAVAAAGPNRRRTPASGGQRDHEQGASVASVELLAPPPVNKRRH